VGTIAVIQGRHQKVVYGLWRWQFMSLACFQINFEPFSLSITPEAMKCNMVGIQLICQIVHISYTICRAFRHFENWWSTLRFLGSRSAKLVLPVKYLLDKLFTLDILNVQAWCVKMVEVRFTWSILSFTFICACYALVDASVRLICPRIAAFHSYCIFFLHHGQN